MGQLLDQPIGSLFRGISRQPQAVRLSGQLQDAENYSFDVGRGGFTKRPGTQVVKMITDVTPGPNGRGFYGYKRDEDEEYLFVYGDGVLKAYTTDGVERNVAFDPDTADYIAGLAYDDMRLATFADFTFTTNRNQVVNQSAEVAGEGFIAASVQVRDVEDGDYNVKIDGVERATFAASFNNHSPADITENLFADLTAPGSPPLTDTFDINRRENHIILWRHDEAPFTLEVEAPKEGHMIGTRDWSASVSDLPARAKEGHVVRIANTQSTAEFHMKFVELGDSSFRGAWEETISPGTPLGFDETSMPHALKRQPDKSFVFSQVDWNEREVGSIETVPNPEFIGQPIKDVLFHKERMTFLAGEKIQFGATGDFFNFFPDKSTQKIDSDPFALSASGNDVATLSYGVSHAALLFAVGPESQWQVSSGPGFSASKADIDKATEYPSSLTCPPLLHGAELYFVSDDGNLNAVYEYFLEEEEVINTAVDVSAHVKGFLEGPLTFVTSHTLTGTMFFGSDARRDTLYVYQLFWADNEKVQSAWSSWTFEGATLHGAQVIGPALYLLIERDGTLFFEKAVLDLDFEETDFPFKVRLDRMMRAGGTYDPATDQTIWTLPYIHNDQVLGVLDGQWPDGMRGFILSHGITYPDTNKIAVPGDFSAHPVIWGLPYRSFATLSEIFLREGDQERAITSAELFLKRLHVDFEETGDFRVEVTHKSGKVDRSKFSFLFSEVGELTQDFADVEREGTMTARARGRSSSLKIDIVNDSPYPANIVAMRWDGRAVIRSRQG